MPTKLKSLHSFMFLCTWNPTTSLWKTILHYPVKLFFVKSPMMPPSRVGKLLFCCFDTQDMSLIYWLSQYNFMSVLPTRGTAKEPCSVFIKLINKWGQPGWLSGLAPPSVQGLILESWDRVPRPAPAWSLLLPLPVSLPLSFSLTLCLSWINK